MAGGAQASPPRHGCPSTTTPAALHPPPPPGGCGLSLPSWAGGLTLPDALPCARFEHGLRGFYATLAFQR